MLKRFVCAVLFAALLLSLLCTPVCMAEDSVPAGVYGTDYIKYGDLDADGDADAKDALEILCYSVRKVMFTSTQQMVGDVSLDCRVDAKDALQVLEYSVGKITTFEAGVYYVINVIDDTPLVDDYIEQYNKSNSVNGAYEKDTTADTSYKLDVSDLEKNTLYKVANSTWATKSGVADQADIQRLLFSLQGLVNRDFGMDGDHTSMMFVVGDFSDTGWLQEMQKEDSIMASSANNEQGLEVVTVRSWDHIEQYFLPVIKKAGIVLWDGDVPATANVAATICGLDGYLPVLAQSPLHKTLVSLGVPVKQSLVGLFANGRKGQYISGTNVPSTGSAKNDAYLWALEKYFNRCSTKYIAYTLDGAPTVKGYSAYTDNPIALLGDAGSNCLSNHDYLIARRCFFFDLDPYKPAVACDDPAQKNGQADAGTDHQTLIKIFERRYERAKGSFGALMGFIPWWLKYTDHHGHNTTKTGPWLEWMFCEIITCYNLAKEADAAHPCSMYNGSFMYKYIPQTKQYQNNKKAEAVTYDSSTYYYTIYVGDYESSAWLKQHMYNMWVKNGGDRNRGNVNMMWSINPNLSERVPVVFDYLYANKSDKDYFVGGDGGAGYIIPSALFHDQTLAYLGEKRPTGNAAAGNVFAQYSKTYYDRFQMDITGFLINGANGGITAKAAACINQYSPVGSFVNASSAGVYKYNGTYYVNCYTGIDSSNAASTMYAFASGGMSRGLNFGAYRTVCHTPTEIKNNVDQFTTYAASKGMNVKYCDPYTYFDLLKQSGQGTEIG